MGSLLTIRGVHGRRWGVIAMPAAAEPAHVYDATLHESILLWLLAVGLGSLTSITLFHLLPEAWGSAGPDYAILYIILGYVALLGVSGLVHRGCSRRHHQHTVACDHSDPLAGIAVNMTASCAHSLQDGMMLGVSFLHGLPYGLVALYSTILHEIPKKLGDYSFIRPRTTLLRTIILLLATLLVTAGMATIIYFTGMDVKEMPWVTGSLAGGFAYYVLGHMLPDLLHRVKVLRARRLPVIIALGTGLIGMSLLMNLLEKA